LVWLNLVEYNSRYEISSSLLNLKRLIRNG
jgi:hypothetical protein